MAPRVCPIDGKPWGTCTSIGYVPPLPPKAPLEDPDETKDPKRVVPDPANVRSLTNRPVR